ncbi:unnamed protein product [Closterium sp. NIES-53]
MRSLRTAQDSTGTVRRYSSPATTALGRLLLPYLFAELSAFATVEDLVSHLRTSDARYHAALPAEFLAKNPPPMYITLYFIVTYLLDSLRTVRDHFLALDPTALTVDLLEQHLLAAETSVVTRGASGGSVGCPYVIRTGDRARQTCGKLNTQHCGFSRLNDAWRTDFGDEAERLRWAELLRSGVVIFDLDYDAILAAMYALSVSAEGDCYLCVPPDLGIEAAVLGASDTTLTPLSAPIPVRIADPSRGPVVARSSTVLPCPAVPSGSLSGLHLPSFSTNLVNTAALQDAMVTTTTLGGQRVSARSGSTPLLMSPPVAPDPSVAPPPGSPLSPTPSWHALPSPCLWSSQVSASLPPSPAPPCLPCVEGQQRAAPHSSFPPMTAPLQTLHTDVGGELSSNLLRDFCHAEGILQSFTLPDSPQQNGIAERRIGLVMEVARTSMIHAAAPHLLWLYAVRYAAHQLNLWPHVSLPETSPTLRWTGKVGDASVFRVWGSRAFVRDTSAGKLSARAIPCVFLGFSPDVPGWQFYHPTLGRVFPSQDVTFDESVPFYRLFPYRSAPPPPPPLFLAPGRPLVDPLPPKGHAPSGVSQVDPLPGTAPIEVAFGSGAALGIASGGVDPGGAESEGAGSGGAEPGGAEPGGAEPEGVEPGGAASKGAEYGGVESRGTASYGGPVGVSPRLSPRLEPLSPQQLREWFAQRTRLRAGEVGAGGSGAGGAGRGGVGAVDLRAGGVGGIVRPRPYFVPLLQQVLGVLSSNGLPPPLLCPRPDQSQQLLQPASPLPAPSPYTEQTGGLTERREPASRHASPVRTGHLVPRPRPPPVLGTHAMALRPSPVPLRVPLPAPLASSISAVSDPESDGARAASPTVSRLLTTVVTDPSFKSTTASALLAELVDFAAACRLDYATALVAESASASPPSVGGECALGTDVLEGKQEDFECLAATQGPWLHRSYAGSPTC